MRAIGSLYTAIDRYSIKSILYIFGIREDIAKSVEEVFICQIYIYIDHNIESCMS